MSRQISLLAAVASGFMMACASDGSRSSACQGTCDAGTQTSTVPRPPLVPPPPVGSDVGRYQVLELTVENPSDRYGNPWEQVSLQADFTAPSGQSLKVDGFFYDRDTWKLRFAPAELGRYTYRYTLTDDQGTNLTKDGAFVVGETQERGFVRVHPSNPHRFVFEKDGGLFSAQGLSTCVRDPVATQFPTREESKGYCIDKYAATDNACLKTVDEFLDVYVGQTDIDLFRWTVNNCSFPLWQQVFTDRSSGTARPDNFYDAEKGRWGDALVRNLRARGVRIFLEPIGFGWRAAQAGRTGCGPNLDQDCGARVCGARGDMACTDHNAAVINTNDLEAIQRYYRYIVARYGAYVDVWELINEFPLPDAAITQLTGYVRQVDPYGHVITTSWARPDHPEIDLSSPHLYQRSDVFDIDQQVVDALVFGQGQSWPGMAGHGKPVIVGEMGEPFMDRTNDPDYVPQTRHGTRIKLWTSFFNEIGLIFWESSLSAAQWLGGVVFFSPEVRGDTRAHMAFVNKVHPDVKPVAMQSLSQGGQVVRRYELRGADAVYLYLVHAVRNVNSPGAVRDLNLQVDLPAPARVQWVDPLTGQVLESMDLAAGSQNLTVPDFEFDIALSAAAE